MVGDRSPHYILLRSRYVFGCRMCQELWRCRVGLEPAPTTPLHLIPYLSTHPFFFKSLAAQALATFWSGVQLPERGYLCCERRLCVCHGGKRLVAGIALAFSVSGSIAVKRGLASRILWRRPLEQPSVTSVTLSMSFTPHLKCGYHILPFCYISSEHRR